MFFVIFFDVFSFVVFCSFLPSGSSWDESEGRLALSQAESDGQSADAAELEVEGGSEGGDGGERGGRRRGEGRGGGEGGREGGGGRGGGVFWKNWKTICFLLFFMVFYDFFMIFLWSFYDFFMFFFMVCWPPSPRPLSLLPSLLLSPLLPFPPPSCPLLRSPVFFFLPWILLLLDCWGLLERWCVIVIDSGFQ